MPEVTFDKYYRYEELTEIVQAFAEENPDLVQLKVSEKATRDGISGWRR